MAEAYEDKVIQLKTNKLPKGLITLGNIFDCEDSRNDKRKFIADKGDYIELQVEDGRKVKIWKDIPQHDTDILIHLCDEYMGVIIWSCDELRWYNIEIIQHTIELIEGANPVR